MIPASVYRKLQWVRVGLDHLDDPFTYASTIYFGFTVIDMIVKATLGQENPIEKSSYQPPKTAEEVKEVEAERTSRIERWKEKTAGNKSNRYQLMGEEQKGASSSSLPSGSTSINRDSLRIDITEQPQSDTATRPLLNSPHK